MSQEEGICLPSLEDLKTHGMLRGKSIIMISEEIMELLGMADRILIMKDGKINGEFLRSPELKDTDLVDNMI